VTALVAAADPTAPAAAHADALSAHGALALALATGAAPHPTWRATMPAPRALDAAMPLRWPERYHALLPERARGASLLALPASRLPTRARPPPCYRNDRRVCGRPPAASDTSLIHSRTHG